MRFPRIAFSSALALLLLSLSGICFAASTSLNGTVTDSSGSVIPEAAVTATNVATNIAISTSTDKAGVYVIPNLTPGTYEVAVKKDGFKSTVRPGVVLHTDTATELNFVLEVGSLAQTVTVEAGAPLVELSSATIGGTVTERSVVELPLNGRSWTDLATLQPGVSSIRALPGVTTPDRLGRGLGNQLTITGGRPQQNNYTINGISMNDYTNGAPGSLLGGNMGVDAIQEFSVLTTNYSAEYGRTSGGVVSAVTRAGTNTLHGDAYEFLRNSAFDARNFFDGPSIPPFRRNQFGASAGGPIKKDNTFVFADYEGLRQNLAVTQFDMVPSPAARGIGPNGQPAVAVVNGSPLPGAGQPGAAPNPDPVTHIDQAVLPYLAFYPLPNGPISGDTGQYLFAGAQISTENFFTTRLDHRFSAADSLFGMYMFDSSFLTQNDEFNNKVVDSRTRHQMVTLQEDHVFSPAVLNSGRFGFNRSFGASPLNARAANPLAADTSLGFAPGQTAGEIDVPGLTSFSGGLSIDAPQQWAWDSFQAYDDVYVTRGINAFKFGANVEYIQDNSISSSAPGGVFGFGSLYDFLTNVPQTLKIAVPSLLTPRHLRQTIAGAYVQDDVKLFPNLTVNLGVRYEMATVPSETSGKMASLTNMNDTSLHLGNPLFSNPTLRNFEPRIGLAWDPFHNGKTSIRSGFGMFDVLPLPIELRGAVFAVWPYFDAASTSSPAVGSFPSGAFASLPLNETSARVDYFQPNPPRNYVMQWNLSIEQQLTANMSILVGYVGSRAVHNVLQTDDSDIVLPTLTPQGYVWPTPYASGQILNPNVGRISGTFFNSDAHYNGLQVQINKRLSHGFQAGGSYTWSRAIDTSSGSTDGDQFLNGISSLFFFDPSLRRAPSDFNITHNLVLNYTWTLPDPKFNSAFANWPLSGWEWGGILTIESGVPFTPILGGDVLGLNNTDPFDFPQRLTGSGCQNPINPGNPDQYIKLQCFSMPTAPNTAFWQAHCDQTSPIFGPGPVFTPEPYPICFNYLASSGRNSLIGPGLVNFDMSLFKNNPIPRISETFNIQFRAEAFNIFNRANFSPPTDNNTLFDGNGNLIPTAGTLDATSTTSRQLQFALKVIW